MNNDQMLAFGRTLLTFVGTSLGAYLVSHGYLSKEQVSTLGGVATSIGAALLTALPIALSLYGSYKANSVKSKTASVAASLPTGGVIKTTPELAAAIPDPKVQAVAK